jgi:hypothetical protein
MCLICGHIGCGRYDGAHAVEHFRETNHTFAMELESQRVWDYSGDGYVHRLVQDRTDGKVVEVVGSPPRFEGVLFILKGLGMMCRRTKLIRSSA